MFTGIVEETGRVTAVNHGDEGVRLRIGSTLAEDKGQSVMVSGACLTVEDYGEEWFEVFLSRETVEKTTLGDVEEGQTVNLERALQADGRLDGHFVQGHVDTTTPVTGVERVGEDWIYSYEVPENHSRYIVEKGSIALDGVSLTVAALNDEIDVAVIPETRQATNMSEIEVGDSVNVEVDLIAKYVESIVSEGYPRN